MNIETLEQSLEELVDIQPTEEDRQDIISALNIIKKYKKLFPFDLDLISQCK